MDCILVTPRSLTKGGHPSLKRLADAGYEVLLTSPGVQPDEAELLVRLEGRPGCAGYLAGVEKVSARVIEAGAAGGLKVIARNGVGLDNVDLDAARRVGIAVLGTPAANTRGVAELTIALILSLARWVPPGDAILKAGRWERRQGIELDGRTLGLVGCGRIGRLVATLARGLGLRTIGCDPCWPDGEGELHRRSLDQVLSESDIVSLHVPLQPGEPPIIDARAIGRMKNGAWLVNTARAGLIDPAAMLAALDCGQLAGLAIDVFDAEPPGDDPLVRHPRVIATPHVGAFTGESVNRSVTAAVENILSVLSA